MGPLSSILGSERGVFGKSLSGSDTELEGSSKELNGKVSAFEEVGCYTRTHYDKEKREGGSVSGHGHCCFIKVAKGAGSHNP